MGRAMRNGDGLSSQVVMYLLLRIKNAILVPLRPLS